MPALIWPIFAFGSLVLSGVLGTALITDNLDDLQNNATPVQKLGVDVLSIAALAIAVYFVYKAYFKK